MNHEYQLAEEERFDAWIENNQDFIIDSWLDSDYTHNWSKDDFDKKYDIDDVPEELIQKLYREVQ